MKNLFKWSSYLLAAALIINVACSDDEEPAPDNTPQVAGEWVFATATLVDGAALTPDAEDLTVANLPGSPISVGDVQTTSVLVGGVLAGAACTDLTMTDGFYIELTETNGLNFYCPLTEEVNEEGSWNLIEDDGSYTLALSVDIDGTGVTIPVTGIQVIENSASKAMTGQAVGFPVPADVALPIGIDNIQFITVDLVLNSK